MKTLKREEAWNLLTEYNKTAALQKHALAVEAAMRHFAKLKGEDEELWGVVGLLHDLDYEMFPEEHCKKAEEIMKARDIDEFYIHPDNFRRLIVQLIYLTHCEKQNPRRQQNDDCHYQ